MRINASTLCTMCTLIIGKGPIFYVLVFIMIKVMCSIFLLFFLLPGSAYSADRVVRISCGEWGAWAGAELPHYGFVNHVIAKAFERAGYAVEFKFYPWPRAYDLVVDGEVDASSYWFKNEERQKTCLYSDPVNAEEFVFFHRKDKPMPKWEKLSDLCNVKIGVNTGVTYTDEFWRLGRDGVLQFDRTHKHEDNFSKLLDGRTDIFPAAKMMGMNVLRENFRQEDMDRLIYDMKPLAVRSGYLLFSRKVSEAESMRAAFNKALASLRADGTYERMLQDLYEGKYNSN